MQIVSVKEIERDTNVDIVQIVERTPRVQMWPGGRFLSH